MLTVWTEFPSCPAQGLVSIPDLQPFQAPQDQSVENREAHEYLKCGDSCAVFRFQRVELTCFLLYFSL